MHRKSIGRSPLFTSFGFYLPAVMLMFFFGNTAQAQQKEMLQLADATQAAGNAGLTKSSEKLSEDRFPSASSPVRTIENTAQALPSQSLKDAMATRSALNRNPGAEKNDAYRIGPGDLLDIRVFNQTQLSVLARVSGQGMIRLLFVGEIPAACLTESELSAEIAQKYKKYINDPQVDVFIKEYQSQPVAVIGAVEKPAQFQLQRRVRLLELLTLAGGPTDKAGHTIHVIHSGAKNLCQVDEQGGAGVGQLPVASSETPEGISLSSFKMNDLLSGGAATNIYIEPGDVVSVPQAEMVFVTGAVFKPSQVPMTTKITLAQAIAMAGGTLPDAAKKKVRLSRLDAATGARIEKVFNLEEIEKRRAEDVVLEANDVIDVPTSTGRSLLRSFLNQIAPTAGTIPLVIVR